MAEKAASLLLCILVISVLFFPPTAQSASILPCENTWASRKSTYPNTVTGGTSNTKKSTSYEKGGGGNDRVKLAASPSYSPTARSKTGSSSPKGGGGNGRAKVAVSRNYSPAARSKTGSSSPGTPKPGKMANGGAK